jgi:hypothetical protein
MPNPARRILQQRSIASRSAPPRRSSGPPARATAAVDTNMAVELTEKTSRIRSYWP